MQSSRWVVLALVLSTGSLSGCGDDASSIGGTCTDNGGCGDGLTCDTTVAGGYCTKACTMPGETTECPGGSICDTGEGAAVSCVQICEVKADCREPLECNGVSGSNIKACKPNDQAVADAGVADAGSDATP